ncbi:MAG: rod shape-determining protein MreD [Oscillospiraceae bacterium]|nr:rod shape-determining protein MreD [Oscillospiraceae bacterium]
MSARAAAYAVWALYGALTLFVFLLQLSLFPALLPVRPMWLPLLPLIVAVLEGEWSGLWFGLAAGVLCDTVFFGTGVFYSVALMLLSAAAGRHAGSLFSGKVAACAAICPAGVLLTGLLHFLFCQALPGRAGIAALWLIAAPEAAVTLLSAPLLFLPAWLISRIRPAAKKRAPRVPYRIKRYLRR